MAAKSKFQKLTLPLASGPRGSLNGLAVVADYAVGDHRVLVLERPDSVGVASAKRKARTLASQSNPQQRPSLVDEAR